ncbi:SCP2 sterol-binding domain-containing protein [Rhodocaloribacter litoris]|uniref:SCP2 sterol-binding domain-containing protein n=1 Tax=Rhodocaloribacter litoris TaxID=2558931 RepID=UPI00141DA63B|nr:SCP2 sterol-binding domain-containing protein [Rhodocaloribacter litoris]QXD14367.1 SCP2 sterol-binding domain-containing protein [Rhodocaloribacter litoris]GIV60611.1 MAG: hypothetical protein KatS3mg043_1700 [Rhodothermaceae bacterium]
MAIETLQDLFEAYKANFVPARAEGIEATFQLHLSGEGGGDYVLRVQDQELTIEEGVAENPTTTLKSSVEDWINLSLGKANPMTLMMTGRLKVSGSIPMATRFQSMFRTG